MLQKPIILTFPFRISCNGLLRLHRLRIEGKHDSDEADRIRDELDAPWDEMTPVERERFMGLSADLYSISDPQPPMRPSNPQVQKNLDAARKAYDEGNWDAFLEILRHWKDYLPLPTLSYLRSSAWAGIGEWQVALAFAEHALHLDPGNEAFRSQRLQIVDVADPVGAGVIAREIRDNYFGYSFETCFFAFKILFGKARMDADKSEWAKLLPLGIHLVEGTTQSQAFGGVFGEQIAIDMLGNCYANAGLFKNAIEVYEWGLRKWPDRPEFLIGSAILKYSDDPKSAIEDLERAAKSRPLDPSFLLLKAHYHLVNGEYPNAIKFADLRLSITATEAVRSVMLEWKAIAFYEMGIANDQIVALFDEAIRLDPQRLSVKHNRAILMQSAVKLDRDHHPNWEIGKPEINTDCITIELSNSKPPKPKLELAA